MRQGHPHSMLASRTFPPPTYKKHWGRWSMSASVLIFISPTTCGLCLPICPLYCLHGKLTISALAHHVGHRDSSLAFGYCDWENLLVCGLSHPGDGLCHFLSQLLGLMQLKPLLRLLMMTKEQDSWAWAEDDAILNIRGIPLYHISYGSNCPRMSQGWQP